MSVPIAAAAAAAKRGALYAALVLVSLMGAALAVAAVAPMAAMTDTSTHELMAGMGETSAATATSPAAVALVADAGLEMGGICDRVCVSEVTAVCTMVLGLVVMTLMALLLATRRDTFVGLLARIRSSTGAVRRREPTPWTVLSLASLGVLRV